jgi:hypothetical protein
MWISKLQHSPSLKTSYFVRKLAVARFWEVLGEKICKVITRRDVDEFEVAGFESFAHKVVVDVYVFCAGVETGISCQLQCSLVVVEKIIIEIRVVASYGELGELLEFLEISLDPNKLSTGKGHRHIRPL